MNKSSIYVSQKALILNDKEEVLALERSKSAPSRPLHWDLPGGDLEFGEEASFSILREVEEETGIINVELNLFDVESHITEKGEFWVTIAYIGKVKNTKVVLSEEHSDYKWKTPDQFIKLKISPKIERFVKKLLSN
jgi:8-oxo-dGTP diphosphatase